MPPRVRGNRRQACLGCASARTTPKLLGKPAAADAGNPALVVAPSIAELP